ncbi:MAG: UDP-N-acetylmuramoyl-L-alanyl-D-glutamate--2,6-diaminopimelate ligase [Muribaculaceae bacterium]|nr:UDP-N-acetylmuramoyl-L-alanyl-D-glutamate--2,6-diaminopimelate ligase [Muribaculaceae bacterium]
MDQYNDNQRETSEVTLEVLLDSIVADSRRGTLPDDTVITAITADSRQVVPGALFVAVRGVEVDGHRFIGKAIEAGAAAVVAEELPDSLPEGVAGIVVSESRVALGHLASRFYGDPSDELTLVGVTGTNGKTTIATLLYEMARMRGLKAGLLSTVANIIDTTSIPAEHTTPDAVMLNRLLRQMVDAGCTFASMEVSSHAADQHRIAGLTFAGGIFTNLTRDHLDYHKTFDAYLQAKKSFFDMLPPEAFALTNADDRNGEVMLQNTAARPRATYSVRDLADFRVRPVEERIDGMLLDFDGTQVETRFVGRFNASNLAAVYGAAILLGVPREDVLIYMSRLVPVAGRFQPFRSADGVTGIVDYAHTPDALINVLDTIRDVAGDARVITVCGAGGNRDNGKRPLMARAAAERSDVVILTSDNPRNEDPVAILDEMAAGLDHSQRARTEIIVDRAEAIRHAVAIAPPGDVILLAGKGHETTQTIGDRVLHFDDREEISRELAARGK